MSDEIEFKKWPKIKRFTGIDMVITQKLDGTNAQLLIDKDKLVFFAGSRNKWLDEDKDNFGFFKWAKNNRDELAFILGRGRHYGEWCGPGIQTGEGLAHRKLFLFNTKMMIPNTSKHLVEPVPVLYKGPTSIEAIYNALWDLENSGSAVNGFDRPEGIIINIGGKLMKAYVDQKDEIGDLL